MSLRRFVVVSVACLSLFIAYLGGCGGDGQTGNLSSSGAGGSGDPCKGLFPDQGTDCLNCLMQHCALQYSTCCASTYGETLAEPARCKPCSGADCYGTQAMPGPIKSLVDDPDFGGGPTSSAWKAAEPLIACTVMNCPLPLCSK